MLGPLRVRDAEGRDRAPDGDLQRRLLALLVLGRGRVVTVGLAVDALWARTPPGDPVGALQNHVSRLRRVLPEGAVGSTAEGYRLDPAHVDVDADRLGALVPHVEGGGDPAALAALDQLLRRWHGPAYPELDDLDDARAEVTRLAELRVRALEARASHRLAAGDTDGLVAELAALAEAEPLRERPRELLMDALAATGRYAEALRVYDGFRRRLGAELGIEPSPVLAARHAELLRGSGGLPWVPPGRLPVPATGLLGRGSLVAEVLAAVDGHRVVTLVGPGGVGKTRVLVEVGHRLAVRPGDRPVVLCELAPAVEGSALDLVLASLGIDGRPGVGPSDRVTGVLGDREAVVLLDNCEHVLDAVAALVEHVVGRCPNVTVVATSRERLRVPGERVCPVPTLDAGANDSTAAELFVERARAVAPGFTPGAAERAVIADVVRCLDGLPLAIELAAALLHSHDVSEVAAGLDHRFSLLSSGSRTTARHGSLRAAVSWSFDLLDQPLREAFADLSVLAGSFTVDDAAAVTGLDRAGALVALGQLGERSLVLPVPGRRYVLLETLRAYGLERLREMGRTDAARARHARHQVDRVEDAARRQAEPGSTALADVDAALPELRAALAWLLDHGGLEGVVLAGRLVVAVRNYGFFRVRPDVLGWAERVIAADPGDRSPHAAAVWGMAADAAWMAGDLAETRVRSRRARELDERAGAVSAEVGANWGNTLLFEGDLAGAARWYRRAAAVAGGPELRRLIESTELLALGYAGDPAVTERAEALAADLGEHTPYDAYGWYCAGEAVLGVDPGLAGDRYALALAVAARTGTSFVTGVAGASKASLDARLGDPDEAAATYRRLIAHWRRAGMWSTQWTMLRSIAGLLARRGRPVDAAVLEGAVRATSEGHRLFGADEVALAELGEQLRATLGDEAYETARRRGAALGGDAAVEHALGAL